MRPFVPFTQRRRFATPRSESHDARTTIARVSVLMRTDLTKQAQDACQAAGLLRKESSAIREMAKETRRHAQRIAEEMKQVLDAARQARTPR